MNKTTQYFIALFCLSTHAASASLVTTPSMENIYRKLTGEEYTKNPNRIARSFAESFAGRTLPSHEVSATVNAWIQEIGMMYRKQHHSAIAGNLEQALTKAKDEFTSALTSQAYARNEQ